MDLKENTKNFEEDLLREHDHIITYLQKNGKFQTFINKSKHDYALDGKRTQSFSAHQQGILINHFNKLCSSYGISMSTLYDDKKVKKNKSYTAKVTKRLNYFLKEYSNHIGIDIEHPIQVFTLHEEKLGKISSEGFHFACARTGISPNRKQFSYDNITLDEAIERGTEGRYSTAQIMHKNKSVKYFRNMRDVLKWDDENIEPVWFRKSGPLAADFRAGFVYERKGYLDELNSLVSHNKILVFEGTGGAGKSVLIRNYAYNLLRENTDVHIYHFSFKSDLAIVDFHDFLSSLNQISGFVIIEDVHLATSQMQAVINSWEKRRNVKVLLTARPSFRYDMLSCRPDITNKCSVFTGINYREHMNDCENLIDYYISRHSESIISAKDMKSAIMNVCKENFWLLSYALKGYEHGGEPISWIKEGVLEDLRDIANPDFLNCNPEILIALSPLYINEVMTAQSYLIRQLGFIRSDIEKLVKVGEISKQEFKGKIFYGLPHSTLASVYWEYGEEYKASLSFHDYEDFVYQYAISGATNALQAVAEAKNEISNRLLSTLFGNNMLPDIIHRNQSLSYLHKVIAYCQREYLSHEPTANAISERLIYSSEFDVVGECLKAIHNIDPDLSNLYKTVKEKINNRITDSDNFSQVSRYILCVKDTDITSAIEICRSYDIDDLSRRLAQSVDVCSELDMVWAFYSSERMLGRNLCQSLHIDKLIQKLNMTPEAIVAQYNYFALFPAVSLNIAEKITRHIDYAKAAKSCLHVSSLFDISSYINQLNRLNKDASKEFCRYLNKEEILSSISYAYDVKAFCDLINTISKVDNTIAMNVCCDDAIKKIYEYLHVNNHEYDLTRLVSTLSNHNKSINKNICKQINVEKVAKELSQVKDLFEANNFISSLHTWNSSFCKTILGLLDKTLLARMIEEDFGFSASLFLSCIFQIDKNIAKILIDAIHFGSVVNRFKERYFYWEKVLFIAIASYVSPEAALSLWPYVDAARLAESFLEDKALYYFADVGDANPMLIQEVLKNLNCQQIADCLSWSYPCSWISDFINYIKCKNEEVTKLICQKIDLDVISERLVTGGDDALVVDFIKAIRQISC